MDEREHLALKERGFHREMRIHSPCISNLIEIHDGIDAYRAKKAYTLRKKQYN